MAGPVPDLAELAQRVAGLDDHERPRLRVLGAAGVAAGVEDAREVLALKRLIGETADRSLVRDGVPNRIGHGRGRRIARTPVPLARAPNGAPGSGRRWHATAAARSAASSGAYGPPSASARNAATPRR